MRRHALFVLVAAGCAAAPVRRSPTVDQRIQFSRAQVAARPELYPAYVELAEAYLDKARESPDPGWLAKSREALERSLKIQPTYEAFLLMTRLCNHAHRFQEALHWGRRAALDASVNGSIASDTVVLAAMVEAHLARGELDAAAALLPPPSVESTDYHVAAARGRWLASAGRADEAVRELARAGRFAAAEGVPAAEGWALVMAAGVLLDSGRADEAEPYLEAAARVDAEGVLLRLHRAELLEARDRWREALSTYEVALGKVDSPDIHRRAYRAALRAGDEVRARRHFAAAERGFQRAVDAGEVYTLGGLAELYADAGVKLDRALALATDNLKYRRDAHARATAERLRRQW